MLEKRTKLFLTVCALLLCLVGGISVLIRYQKMTSCYNVRPSLKSINVNIDPSQSQQLIEKLEKFTDKNGFKFQISYYNQNGNDFSVWMKRKDVEVIVRSPFDPGEFKIGFYNNDCVHPTIASDLDSLVSDLKISINEIPNAEISEEK